MFLSYVWFASLDDGCGGVQCTNALKGCLKDEQIFELSEIFMNLSKKYPFPF